MLHLFVEGAYFEGQRDLFFYLIGMFSIYTKNFKCWVWPSQLNKTSSEVLLRT